MLRGTPPTALTGAADGTPDQDHELTGLDVGDPGADGLDETEQPMTLASGQALFPALGIGAFAEKTLVAAGQCTKPFQCWAR